MGGDGEDVHVYYGTPLISEEELNPRKRKSAVDQGQARQVAPWNQEVSISHMVSIWQARFCFLRNYSALLTSLWFRRLWIYVLLSSFLIMSRAILIQFFNY